MAGFFLSETEQILLRGVPDLVSRLYVLQLRPRMNLKTRLVGEKPNTVNWATLARFLAVDPAPGIKAETYSRDQIRRACAHLEKLELVVNRSTQRTLILELPHAAIYDKAANMEQAQQASLFIIKAAHLIERLPVELQGFFCAVNPEADILIDTKPAHLERAKPASIVWLESNYTRLKDHEAARREVEKNQLKQNDSARFEQNPPDSTSQKPPALITTLPNLTEPNSMSDPVLGWRKACKELGFDGKRLSTSVLMLFREWHRRGVSLDTVAQCLEVAKSRLGRMPDTPVYLREIVDEYLERDNHSQASVHLNGYTAPLDSLSLFVINDGVFVLAPGPAEAERCFKNCYPGQEVQSRHRLGQDDSFYAGDELGEITVRDAAAVWLRDGRQVPAVIRSISG